jgi:alkanesulfonate monooxygenase SsuD/methylene tetrahydromethanopterin reductase-like flavin-dependent oxidoreductase (luciferase family)
MQIGIGLPGTIPGTHGATILDWARRADAGPFSSLAVLDRIVYPNYEPLITLAAAAAVTQRARLMTTVLLATTRNAGVLAKQAASLDALSSGRLSLGLGIGAREDDFLVAGEPFRNRGRRFEEQLALMKRIWAGEPPLEGIAPVGPKPVQANGPEVLLGGYTPQAAERVARWANGYIAGGSSDPQRALQFYQVAERAWREAGRPGKPRFVAAFYWALGLRAEEGVRAYIGDYYRGMGPNVETMIRGVPTSEQAIRERVGAFEGIGVDELLLWPCIAELDQVDRLAQVVA